MRTYEDQVDYYKKNTELCLWSHKRARDFRIFTSYEIKTEEYHKEFALALAWSAYCDGKYNKSKFMDDWGLDEIDALCYLHEETGVYEKEIEEAFDKELLKNSSENFKE